MLSLILIYFFIKPKSCNKCLCNSLYFLGLYYSQPTSLWFTIREIYSYLTFFCTFYDLNRVESQVEIFYIHEAKITVYCTVSLWGKMGKNNITNPDRESHIAVPPPLPICSRRWVSVWSKSLPVCRSRPWNYLITTWNTVANCCFLIGPRLTAMTIWWEVIYLPAIFPWVMSPVKMITSFNHTLFGWIGVGAK